MIEPPDRKKLGVTFSADYAWKRWVDVEAFVELKDKDSSVDVLDYDRSIMGVNFNFSL